MKTGGGQEGEWDPRADDAVVRPITPSRKLSRFHPARWGRGQEEESTKSSVLRVPFLFLLGHISYVEDALVLPMMDYAFPLSHWDRTAYGSGSGGFFINFFNRVIYIDGEILYPSLSLSLKKKKNKSEYDNYLIFSAGKAIIIQLRTTSSLLVIAFKFSVSNNY